MTQRTKGYIGIAMLVIAAAIGGICRRHPPPSREGIFSKEDYQAALQAGLSTSKDTGTGHITVIRIKGNIDTAKTQIDAWLSRQKK